QNATHLAEKMIELAPQTIDKIQSMFQKEEKKEGNHHPQNPDEIL
ncbi:sporulation protein YtfJ, partial [Bacillus thuringiensis]